MSAWGVVGVWAYVALTAVFAVLAGRHAFREDQIFWRKATTRERWVVVGRILAVALMAMCLWPVFIVIMVLWKWFPRVVPRLNWGNSAKEKEMNVTEAEPVFSVSPSHLGRPVTIEEVEAANYVTDPLEGVPALPFGHLHTRWLQLRSHVRPGCTLHGFDVLFRQARYQPVRRYRGWAVVDSDRVVVSHWVAAVEVVHDPV